MPSTKKYLPGLLLLTLAVVMGIIVYPDYGIAWDEPVQREMGIVSYNYVFLDDPALNTYIERDHGTGFELPLIILERVLGLSDYRDIFLMRHLAAHLFFLCCAFCGYVLGVHLFGSRMMGALCFLMLVLHPRIYVHSFVNTKDLPFLAVHIVCLMLSYFAFTRQRWAYFLLLGLACGYVTSIRIMGILITGVLLIFMLFDIVRNLDQRAQMFRQTLYTLLFILSFCGMLYLSWPTLWERPVQSFLECYRSLSHFRWEGTLLFDGQLIPESAVPKAFLPVWFLITTPLVWLGIGLIGISTLLISFIRNPGRYLLDHAYRQYLICGVVCLAPFAAVIVLGARVYDDWRHVFFTYPAFVMLSLYGIQQLKRPGVQKTVKRLLLVQAIIILVFFIRNHPFQQVYFNRLISHKPEALRHKFDLDYWGLSFKQALEFIARTDTSDTINIAVRTPPLQYNMDFLKEPDRSRVRENSFRSRPCYFLTNFRGHPEDYDDVPGRVVHEIQVQGSTIMRVYKME